MTMPSSARWVPDSHCHLDCPQFAEDLDRILAGARAARVGPLVTICTKPSQIDRTRTIAHAHADVFYAAGVHPHHAATEPAVTADSLIGLADDPKLVALGETGLDYHYTRDTRSAQLTSLQVHIEAARATDLPLVIHARDADDDMIEVLGTAWNRAPFRCIMHCYSSGQQLADLAIACQFHLSIAGNVTFRNADALRRTVATIPPAQVLVETDAPYLAPVPHRGQRNEPALVRHTAACVADLLHLSMNTFAEQVHANTLVAFPRIARTLRDREP